MRKLERLTGSTLFGVLCVWCGRKAYTEPQGKNEKIEAGL